MTRMTAKFLATLLALGSGASAMAGPGPGPQCGPQGQAQAGPQPQDQYEEGAQNQASPRAGGQQQAPSQADEDQDQDQDQDVAETFAWSTGPSHLGVLVTGMTPELRQHFGAPADVGVLIAKVEPGSPAMRAGIQVGDVIVRVGSRRVRTGDDVIQALAAQTSGQVRLIVIRQGRAVRFDATLGGHPQPQKPSPESQL